MVEEELHDRHVENVSVGVTPDTKDEAEGERKTSDVGFDRKRTHCRILDDENHDYLLYSIVKMGQGDNDDNDDDDDDDDDNDDDNDDNDDV